MNARSALFDVYGDHLRSRGGSAPVAALVRLMAALGVAPPAVRTAISRMVRQGWLAPARVAGAPGYELTPRAVTRLDEAARRIYRQRDLAWDETWHVVVPAHVAERTARDRLRSGLAFLGYGQLSHDTWVSPRPSPELAALLASEEVAADLFTARHFGDPTALVRRAWDLGAIAAAYERWLQDAELLIAAATDRALTTDRASGPDGAQAGATGPPAPAAPAPPAPGAPQPVPVPVAEPPPAGADQAAFAVRSRLVHEWRKFLFTDPALPRNLLPEHWAGDDAAGFFDTHATRLLPAAARFVDAALTTTDRPADVSTEEHP